MSDLSRAPTVLFVDDEADVLESLKRVFLEDQLKVLTAGSGKEGLEIVGREQVEMVVADFKMPGMNGAELLTAVHAARGDRTVGILLSAFADAEMVAALGEQQVIFAFVAKPWNDEELRLTVKRGLEHQRLVRALRRMEEELAGLKRLSSGLPFGVVIIAPDGTVVATSALDPLPRLFTRRPGVGHRIQAFLDPVVVAAVQRACADGARTAIQGPSGELVACCLPTEEGGSALVTDCGGGLVVPDAHEVVQLAHQPGN